MNKITIAVIVLILAVFLIIYYFLTRKTSPQFFGVINSKSVTLSSTQSSLSVTTNIFAGNSASISISASKSGNYTATFEGVSHSFSSNTTFSSNAISSNVTNTLSISGFGATYSLAINFIAYSVSVVVNGYTLTNSHTSTTFTNVTTLSITINSAPNESYTVNYIVNCIEKDAVKQITNSSSDVTTSSTGSKSFSESAPNEDYCLDTYTYVKISGPGMSGTYTITVENQNPVSFNVTIS